MITTTPRKLLVVRRKIICEDNYLCFYISEIFKRNKLNTWKQDETITKLCMLINVSPQTCMQYVLVHELIKQMNVICTIALRFVLRLCVSYILSLPQVFLSQKLSNFAKFQSWVIKLIKHRNPSANWFF